MTWARRTVGLLVVAAAAACGSAEDARLPWWPAPSVAAPSPLLDAVGLAPPRLDGPGCHRGGSPERTGLRGALLRLASGFEVTCFTPPSGPSDAEADGYAAVTFDGRGRAESAELLSGALAPAAAAAAADSAVRRGLGLPGARPIACPMEGWPYAVLRSDGVVPLVRGWRTPDYDALVLAYPAGPDPAGGAVVHLRASRRGFAGCQAGAGPPETPPPGHPPG